MPEPPARLPAPADVIDETLAKLLALVQCNEGCPDVEFGEPAEARAVLRAFAFALLLQAAGEPPSADASDPHADSTGNPSTRA